MHRNAIQASAAILTPAHPPPIVGLIRMTLESESGRRRVTMPLPTNRTLHTRMKARISDPFQVA